MTRDRMRPSTDAVYLAALLAVFIVTVVGVLAMVWRDMLGAG